MGSITSATNRPLESLYLGETNPKIRHAVLSEPDSIALLERINLLPSLVNSAPSLDLLSKVILAWQTNIPYDTSALHVTRDDWIGPNKPIKLGTGIGMELGQGNFERIAKRRTGGYCYALNTLCAALLRGFGFRVSEVGARVYLFRGKDPAVEGYDWSCITHELLIIDWAGSHGRYMIDAGFGGGGCPYPIPLQDGATSPSLSRSESFLLRQQTMDINSLDEMHDPPVGWTLYRRVMPRGEVIEDPTNLDPTPGYWSPCVHFTLQSILPSDVKMAEYFNSHHPEAPFMIFFVVSILLPSGARKTLAYGAPPIDLKDGEDNLIKAKLYTKEGIKGEEMDVRFIPFETEPIRDVLEKEFGFVF